MEIWITKMSQYMSGKDVIEVDYKVMNTSKQRRIKVVMGLCATFSVKPPPCFTSFTEATSQHPHRATIEPQILTHIGQHPDTAIIEPPNTRTTRQLPHNNS